MGLKHKVTINVTTPGGIRTPVLKGGNLSVRSRLLGALLGKTTRLIVLTPGDSVETVEIREVTEGGTGDGKDSEAGR